MASREHNRWRATGGLVGIAIGAVDGIVGSGEHFTRWQGGGEADAVGAGLEIAEVVVTNAVSGGGANQRVKVVVEVHGHALDAGFASVLEAIAIEVKPHVVANGSERGDVACVDGAIELASGEGDESRLASSDHRVAVRGGCALQGSGEHRSIGQADRELDNVGPWIKIYELIPTQTIGGGGADGGAGAVEQGDSDALDAGFVGILLEVAVQIHPHEVAQRSLRRDVACVDGGVVLASGQRYVGSLARACVGIAIRGGSAR